MALTDMQAAALKALISGLDAADLAQLGVGTSTSREAQDEGVRLSHAMHKAPVAGVCDTCGKTGLIANTRCKRCRAGKAPLAAKAASKPAAPAAPAPRFTPIAERVMRHTQPAPTYAAKRLAEVGFLPETARMGVHKTCDAATCGFCVRARAAHNAAVERKQA